MFDLTENIFSEKMNFNRKQFSRITRFQLVYFVHFFTWIFIEKRKMSVDGGDWSMRKEKRMWGKVEKCFPFFSNGKCFLLLSKLLENRFTYLTKTNNRNYWKREKSFSMKTFSPSQNFLILYLHQQVMYGLG